MSARRAVFLDRDGVINEPVWDPQDGAWESPLRPEDVRLVPGARDALQSLSQFGRLVVVSNQPGAAKGKTTMAGLDATHERIIECLGTAAGSITLWSYCHHHPRAIDPQLRKSCSCRKPSPGMLQEAAAALGIDLAASWMIGDTDADMEAGHRAGCKTILVCHPKTGHKRPTGGNPVARVPDLAAAVAVVEDSLASPTVS